MKWSGTQFINFGTLSKRNSLTPIRKGENNGRGTFYSYFWFRVFFMGTYMRIFVLPFLISIGCVFILAQCAGTTIELRYDAAKSPMETGYHSLLMVAPGSHYEFGMASIAAHVDETLEGKISIYTPAKASIRLFSDACKLDKSVFSDGGVKEFNLSDLFPNIASKNCIASINVRWEVPEGTVTNGLTVYGMQGRIYLSRVAKGTEHSLLRWLPEHQDAEVHKGIIHAHFRQNSLQVTPVKLKVETNKVCKKCDWKIFDCGTTAEGSFTGPSFEIDSSALLAGEAGKVGDCFITGSIVGEAVDGSQINERFAVVRNIFEVSTEILAEPIITFESGKICYDMPNSVSMAVFVNAEGVGEISGDLKKCFDGDSGRLAFFTHKGRAVYCEVRAPNDYYCLQ